MANEHISNHAIGTELRLTWKRRTYIARLANRSAHSEEWRINATSKFDGRDTGYLMSEGWRWVSEQLAR